MVSDSGAPAVSPWPRSLLLGLSCLVFVFLLPSSVRAFESSFTEDDLKTAIETDPQQAVINVFNEVDDPFRFLECVEFSAQTEPWGPTDVHAQTGSQALSVSLNREGTLTVFKWPRPSYYDQIKYHTSDRALPYEGADTNAGAFLGLAYSTATDSGMVWLRELPARQRYRSSHTDVTVTEHRSDTLGLSIRTTDVIPINRRVTAGRSGEPGSVEVPRDASLDGDALIRQLEVRRDDTSPVESVRLIAFENFSLVVSKFPIAPVQDWCFEEDNVDTASYAGEPDVIVHRKTGIDTSTWDRQSVVTMMGFGGSSEAHQVGSDTFMTPDTFVPSARDAYLDALDGTLSGSDTYVGQTTGALARSLDFSGNTASTRVIFSAAHETDRAAELMRAARNLNLDRAIRAKRDWYDELLRRAPMPVTSDTGIVELARRALVTLVQDYDPRSGAVVASITTQAPYGEDWLRDGAYFNYVLDRYLRLHEWVDKRNRWYASLQQSRENFQPTQLYTPIGNWNMNFYADGVAGGLFVWEVDETGYALWLFWDHYRVTRDREYLRDVYPELRRAGISLANYEDTRGTDLHDTAFEDDRIPPSQTIIGGGPAWLGLRSAEEAAKTLDRDSDFRKFHDRRVELGNAIDTHLWNADTPSWGANGHWGQAEMMWPVRFRPYDHPRMQKHVNASWQKVKPTFDHPTGPSDTAVGRYPTKNLIGLAQAWDGTDSEAELRRALRWIANRWATEGTNLLGEDWAVRDGEVVARVAMPHTWEQTLYYQGAIEVYGADRPYLRASEPHAVEDGDGGVCLAGRLGLSESALARLRSLRDGGLHTRLGRWLTRGYYALSRFVSPAR